MVGIITTPEAEIEQKREVKLTDGSGAPLQGTASGGFSEVVAQFVVPADQRSGVGVTVPVQMVQQVRPWGNGRITTTYDGTANDSDKSYTVPAGKVWKLHWLHAEITTTATVGNRLLWVTVSNGTSVYFIAQKLNSVANGQTGVVELYPSTPVNTTAAQVVTLASATPTVGLRQIMPTELYLTAGHVIRVYDTAAIDAAADDMIVVFQYIEYDA